MLSLIKLRKILLSNTFYFLLLTISLLLAFLRIHLNKYRYDNHFKGIVKNIKYEDDKITISINKKLIKYYVKNEEELNYYQRKLKLGFYIKGEGNVLKETPKNARYFRYLQRNNINTVITAEKINIIPHRLFIYKIKEFFIKRCEKLDRKGYLKALVIGHNNVDKEQKKIYQEIGISHLLAISGTHITVLTALLMYILKPLKNEDHRYLVVIIFLLCFAFLSSFAASLIRSATFYTVRAFNKIYYFNITILNTFILAISLLILVKPYLIFNIGFLYSSIISFFLIYYSKYLEGSFFKVLLKTSFISFLASLPLTIYLNSSVNVLSIIYNLFFVNFMSYLFFPLALLKFIFSFLPFQIIISIFEKIANYCYYLGGSFIIKKPSLIFIFILYICLILGLKKKFFYYFFVIILFILYFSKYFVSPSITFFDVGNGDAALISINGVNVMVDTAGIPPPKLDKTYKKYSHGEKIASYIKGEGISQIDYVIVSHGDFDHVGGISDLAKNIKVKEVIFNNDAYNHNERKLIGYLLHHNIPYQKNVKKIKIKGIEFFFLNNKIYNNENDNSLILYFNYRGKQFLFMGDASSKVEEEIIKNYNLSNIDILKAGHHGSNTSSSKKFIDTIKPKRSIISVGLHNKYGHPGKNALYNLRQSRIYRTDQDGCIKFNIYKNNIKDTVCNY